MDKRKDNLMKNNHNQFKEDTNINIELPEVKLSYTKTIVLFLGVVNIILLVFALGYMWITKDSSIFNNLTSIWGGLFATAIGFYIWKAKFENKAKIDGFFKIKLKELGIIESIDSTLDNFDDFNV